MPRGKVPPPAEGRHHPEDEACLNVRRNGACAPKRFSAQATNCEGNKTDRHFSAASLVLVSFVQWNYDFSTWDRIENQKQFVKKKIISRNWMDRKLGDPRLEWITDRSISYAGWPQNPEANNIRGPQEIFWRSPI